MSMDNAALITLQRIREWGACSEGRNWFRENFPQEGDYGTVITALYKDKRLDDAGWLYDKAFCDASNVTAFVQSDIAAVQALTEDSAKSGDDALIGSSGDYAQIGSSGDYAQIGSSGPRAQISSSGDDARIGSSGPRAQIGSSGYDARIGSSGYDAQIGSSGPCARICSSGYDAQISSSGFRTLISSSGDDAQIGSSGDDAQIGSSGDYATIKCAGKRAVVASSGQNTTVTLAEGGAASLTWHDGTRIRFTNLYVGEGGIEAGVAYCLDDAGNPMRADGEIAQ